MKIIGLTGGIGSGKTTVASFLADLGAVVLNADSIGHEIYNTDPAIREKLKGLFGERAVTENGAVDRAFLGRLVFSNPKARTTLERIMHPLIYRRIIDRLQEYRRRGVKVVVLEIPLLVETGGVSMVDEVWVTTAPEATILKRLRTKTGLTEAELKTRIEAQSTSEERLKGADEVIETDCGLEELRGRVKRRWRRIREEEERAV